MLKDKNAELFEQIQELATNSSINSPSFLEELEYSQKSLTSGYCSNLSLLDELDSDEAITMMPVDNLSQVRASGTAGAATGAYLERNKHKYA